MPHEWISAAIAAMQKHMATTPEGAAYIAEYLGLTITPGLSDKRYDIVDEDGQVVDEVKPQDMRFVQGIAANGQFIQPGSLRISERDREPCDDCSILGPCLKKIVDPVDGKKSLCNFCMTHSDSPEVRVEGDVSVCEGCTMMACSHHPLRQWRRA